MIACVGSSSFEPGSPLVAALTAELSDRCQAFGVRGSSVRSWVTMDLTPVRQAAPSRILVYLGANDAAVSADDIRAVDARLREIAGRVDWLALPPYPEDPYRTRARALEERMPHGTNLLRTRFRIERGDLAADGVHLTARGAQRLAVEIRKALFWRTWKPVAVGTVIGLCFAFSRLF